MVEDNVTLLSDFTVQEVLSKLDCDADSLAGEVISALFKEYLRRDAEYFGHRTPGKTVKVLFADVVQRYEAFHKYVEDFLGNLKDDDEALFLVALCDDDVDDLHQRESEDFSGDVLQEACLLFDQVKSLSEGKTRLEDVSRQAVFLAHLYEFIDFRGYLDLFIDPDVDVDDDIEDELAVRVRAAFRYADPNTELGILLVDAANGLKKHLDSFLPTLSVVPGNGLGSEAYLAPDNDN